MAPPGSTLILPIFPNVRVGGDLTVKSNSKYFPLLRGDITSLRFDVAYKYTIPPSGIYNLAYEMFFSDTDQPPNTPKAEVMIWIHATFGQPPSTYRGDYSDGNNTYHLYAWDREDGRFYASFIMDGQPVFEAQHTVDAKELLDQLDIDPKWYFLGTQMGSEIVKGSGKIEISQFSINLNGNKP